MEIIENSANRHASTPSLEPGQTSRAKPPLRPKHVWSIRTRLQLETKKRDLAMFNLGIDSKLRGCDVIAVMVEDVAARRYCRSGDCPPKKTGRPVKFEMSEQTRQAVDDYLRRQRGARPALVHWSAAPLRPDNAPVCPARLRLDSSVGLDPRLFGTHSLRRTKATLIYRRTGNLRAVQLFSAIPRWKAPSAISASRSMTPWQ